MNVLSLTKVRNFSGILALLPFVFATAKPENDYICRQEKTSMASNADFVQFIIDQCSGAGDISVKKMMGDYCIYCDGTIFGLICDNNLYIKPTNQGAAQLKEVVMRSPYPGAKEHFLITDVDDRDYLTDIIKATMPALPKPKARKNPMLEEF